VVFTTEAPLGNVCRIPAIDTEFYIGQRIITLQTDMLVPIYLEYALSSDKFQTKIFAMSSGSTVTGIKSKLLEKMTIPVPSKELQTEFAAFVEQADKSKFVAYQETIFIEKILKYTYNHNFRRKNNVH
jgi:type I restriction enzyme S subunit